MKLSVGIGLLGCGTVGSAVADRLHREHETIERRSGIRYDLHAIGIRDANKALASSLDARLFTSDAGAIIDDPQVDCVIECIGGTLKTQQISSNALSTVAGMSSRRTRICLQLKALVCGSSPHCAA